MPLKKRLGRRVRKLVLRDQDMVFVQNIVETLRLEGLDWVNRSYVMRAGTVCLYDLFRGKSSPEVARFFLDLVRRKPSPALPPEAVGGAKA